ncbi:hypothetical protein ACTMTJ_43485 [Phytohabitans sp. LJ34]|uniref:hypothetical protein n=1 Tax=Phytohabitans sp. LJ34 TaxID=3452217 RepID=UPI003F89C9D8
MRRIAAVAAVLVLAACDSTQPAAAPQTSAPAPAAAVESLPNCAADVPSRVLPEWARTGFSEKEPRMPYVLGERGDIVAIIFGYPLHQPPLPDRSNKILWVSRAPLETGSPLVIEGRLDGVGEVTTREVGGGPGPSIIDLPRPGCWHLDLKWSGHTDTMRLTYQKK